MAYFKLNKGKPIKMESTRNKNKELGRPELSAGSMSLRASRPRMFDDYFWCWSIKVTKIKSFRQNSNPNGVITKIRFFGNHVIMTRL